MCNDDARDDAIKLLAGRLDRAATSAMMSVIREGIYAGAIKEVDLAATIDDEFYRDLAGIVIRLQELRGDRNGN